MQIHVSIANQTLTLFKNKHIKKEYLISTAKNGVGECLGSQQTPRGKHIIRAKIGHDAPINAVFVKRRFTGEIYQPAYRILFPNRDWILTRILWLSGLERGINRLGKVDTMRRYIYIHGTPDDVPMGIPGSKGCIRLRNEHLIELFNWVDCYTPVLIE